MIIKSIHVQNFRCIKDETLNCENLTVLVGANGSGKSAFLRALDIFYNPNAKYDEEDFYARDTSQSIKINEEEKQIFRRYVEGEELTIEKELTWPLARGSQKYYGTSLVNPDFQTFREAVGADLRKEYNRLRGMDKYSNLPPYTNKEEAEAVLKSWEESHPEECIRKRDEGQFFGFKEVGEARLERFTRFILVPAVRDASQDASEGRGSVITEIMDAVVRKALAQRKDITAFQEDVNKRYKETFDPTKIPELQNLENNLTGLLQIFAPNTRVKLDWRKDMGIDIPMPEAYVNLVEDEYSAPVSCTGHGTQRSFILAMLQYLASTEKAGGQEAERVSTISIKLPSLILGIEEPELYQHPDRQRYLSKVLTKLSEQGILGVANQIQVIYSTHSSLFVNIDHFDKIRVLRKIKENGTLPKQTKVYYTTLDHIARRLEEFDNKPKGAYSGEMLRDRLRALMNPWVNEGFFAKFVVLVEGIKDRATILGISQVMGCDLESNGIAVIPCNGKTYLDRATLIFSSFGIPTYTIWDSDYSKKEEIENNRHLLRMFNQPEEDWPEKVTEDFACFKQDLEQTLKNDLGNEFQSFLKEYCQTYGLEEKHAIENPTTFEYVFKRMKERGKSSSILERIVNKIISQTRSIS
ncbi:MAG: ATP-dependent endonuclease [Candidatus Bathyarchaeia archaeon]